MNERKRTRRKERTRRMCRAGCNATATRAGCNAVVESPKSSIRRVKRDGEKEQTEEFEGTEVEGWRRADKKARPRENLE